MKKKLLYGLVGLLFALSLVGFIACSDDDDDDDDDSGGTTDAVYDTDEGEDEESVFTNVAVTYTADNTATKVVVELDGTEYTLDLPSAYMDTIETEDAIYNVFVYNKDGVWYYFYEKVEVTPYTATYSGDSTNALADYTVKVYTYTSKNVIYISYATMTVSSDDVIYGDYDGDDIYSFIVDSEDGSTSTIYTLTFTYDKSSDSYSYTYTTADTTNLTASTSQTSIGTVVVKYNSTSGIAAVVVNDDDITDSYNSSGGTYTYTTYTYNKDESWLRTYYYLKISVTNSAAIYSYTYSKYGYDYYTASWGGTGTNNALASYTITVYAYVTETYNSTSSTYSVSSNSLTLSGVTDSDGNSYDVDDNTFTVESNGTATIYTLELDYSTTNGLAFTYTYDSTSTAVYTATSSTGSALSDCTVKVYYDTTNSSIEKVTVDDVETDYRGESSGSYIYTYYDYDKVQYTLTISVASGAATYKATTTTLTAVSSGTYAGYYTVSDYTLGETADDGGSGLSKMLTADQLTDASEVVILFTCEDGAWFTIACTSDWRGKIDTALDDGTEGDYTLTLSSKGAYLLSDNTNTGAYQYYDANLTWDTSYSSEGVDMVAFYRDKGGLWASGGNCTVNAIYVKYSE